MKFLTAGILFLGSLGVFLFSWPFSFHAQGELTWGKPGLHVQFSGKLRYLCFRRKKEVRNIFTGEQLTEWFFRFREDYRNDKILPQIPFRVFRRYLQKHPHRLKIRQLEWDMTAGFQDACYTAVSCGFLWAMEGIVAGWLQQYFQVDSIRLQVFPDYQTRRFSLRLTGIIPLRLTQIMYIAILGLISGFQNRKDEQSKR